MDHWQITAGNKCPVCREEEAGFNKNYPIEREINSLHIYCTNKEKGCEWQGELNDINDHLGNSKGCQFEEVKCSNECGKMIQRQYLTSHVETECPRHKVNCHDTGEHQFIEGQHKEECPKLPLPCPNKCEVGSVPREDMKAHRKECPLEMIYCEYYSVGCEDRMARKDGERHNKENLEEHLTMTNYELTVTKAQLAATLKQMTNLTAILMNAQWGPHIAANRASIRSVHLNSSAKMLRCGNQICPVTIQISKYSVKKKDEIEWFSYPFYTHNKGYKMYLCVDAAGHGDGRGTHLSVFLYLMKGPHDDELTWPLRGEFEIKLLNQISDSEHHSSTVCYGHDTPDNCLKREGEGWREQEFITNKRLNKGTSRCQFLKDDCLFLQVTKL